jgi:sodium/hydrogen antiporter
MATVLLSIFAHGLTAQPGINLYARRIAALDETSPERQALGHGSPEPPRTPHVGT